MRHKRVENETKDQVSIHASVKDATYSICIVNGVYDVSIHASVKDATQMLD